MNRGSDFFLGPVCTMCGCFSFFIVMLYNITINTTWIAQMFFLFHCNYYVHPETDILSLSLTHFSVKLLLISKFALLDLDHVFIWFDPSEVWCLWCPDYWPEAMHNLHLSFSFCLTFIHWHFWGSAGVSLFRQIVDGWQSAEAWHCLWLWQLILSKSLLCLVRQMNTCCFLRD